MADQNFCAAAIDATSRSTNTYIKFLSANDTGLTGGHQSGILLSKKTCPMMHDSMVCSSSSMRRAISATEKPASARFGAISRIASISPSR